MFSNNVYYLNSRGVYRQRRRSTSASRPRGRWIMYTVCFASANILRVPLNWEIHEDISTAEKEIRGEWWRGWRVHSSTVSTCTSSCVKLRRKVRFAKSTWKSIGRWLFAIRKIRSVESGTDCSEVCPLFSSKGDVTKRRNVYTVVCESLVLLIQDRIYRSKFENTWTYC